MAQYSNEHLTITELSAYLDKELAPEELALCGAHIQSCQPCQAALADLRLTSALLSSMPQVAVPRSFALPTNLVILPETPDVVDVKTPERLSSMSPSIWRRSMRVASTLVAILGLFFVLAGALSSLPHGGATTASSTSNTSSAGVARAPSSQTVPTPTGFVANTPAQTQHVSPDVRATQQATASGAKQATATATSIQHVPNTTPPQDQPSAPPTQLPATLDLGQPAGRLTIGGALLLLGILGAIVTRLLDRSAGR